MSQMDGLTEIFNRGHFWRLVQQRLAALPAGALVSFILFDIDGFKAFNDRHGHLVGDEVLRHCARVTQQQIRNDDVLGRFGGEEFALFLAATSAAQAREVAERIRQAIERSPLEVRQSALSITISVGVVTATTPASLEQLTRESDDAMYRAKRGGKNRTEVQAPFDAATRSAGTTAARAAEAVTAARLQAS